MRHNRAAEPIFQAKKLQRRSAALTSPTWCDLPRLVDYGGSPEIPPSGFGIRASSAYDRATSSVFQSPWCMVCQIGTPRMKASRTNPRRNEWPRRGRRGATIELIRSRNLECESCIRLVVDSEHNVVAEDRCGKSDVHRIKARKGHRRGSSCAGTSMTCTRSRNWFVLE